MKNVNYNWENNVKDMLINNPICGWDILDIKGRGVFLLPSDLKQNSYNYTGSERDLTGKYKIVFEFFRLDKSGKIKISARVASIQGQQLFHEFWGIARACVNDKPQKPTREKKTQSVAKWETGKGKSFRKEDAAGMIRSIRDFFMNPPSDFNWFLAGIRNYINNP